MCHWSGASTTPSIGRIPMGPHALVYADRLLAILRAGGLSDALAVAGHQLLFSVVIGFAIDETGEGGHPPADRPPPDAAAAMARDYLTALPVDRFPHLDRRRRPLRRRRRRPALRAPA
jgi:hypothetical protein